MKKALVLLCLLSCKTSSPTASKAERSTSRPASQPQRKGSPFLKGVRPLILEGKRSGEGYFGKDGSMIFQSERDPKNPFYQIYVHDAASRAITRVSPGIGKTTCGWIHPSGNRYLFSSTHHDPSSQSLMQAELDFRASGKTRRYSWDYDPEFEIYDRPKTRANYRNLTQTRGYDAEASWSPDGKSIVFASNRRAYTSALTEAEKQRLAQDPSYFIDLFLMDADGTNVRQLTQHLGYDGGPFFSPDGKKIVWRRFAADGHKAEIWTMNIDGSEKKPITRLGKMSWAPFYHPSGRYIIFNTNLHGFDNFELYLVDTEGLREPVRVTFWQGWDGLPVFTPKGDGLAWSSSRNPEKKPQIFFADWNHTKALQALGLAHKSPSSGKAAPPAAQKPNHEALSTLHEDVRRLASPEFEGRATGTQGEKLATASVADRLQKIGLQAAGQQGFFSPFDFVSGVEIDHSGEVHVLAPQGDKKVLQLNTDYRPLAFSTSGKVAGELVFVGYGISAPEGKDQAAYDSFAGAPDLKNKWAVVFRYLPEDISPERRQYLGRFARLRFKAMEARKRGAVGLVVISGPRSQVKSDLVPLRFDGTVSGSGLAAISISDAEATRWFRTQTRDLKTVQKSLDQGSARPGFALKGLSLSATIKLKQTKRQGRNVLARLPATRKRHKKPLVIGAHVDHLGYGEGGDSLAKAHEKGKIHPGADDNASGIAAMLFVAETLRQQKPRYRDVIFAAWSGEELGLFGSASYVKKRKAPFAYAYLNFDMVGRMEDAVAIQGIGSSKGWRRQLETVQLQERLPLRLVEDAYLPTDATSFYLAKMPILSFFTGAHRDYHSPRDTPDRINHQGLHQIARFAAQLSLELVNTNTPLDYLKTAPKKRKGSRMGRAFLGTIPDYTQSDVRGVKLSGVAAGGPAEKAGVKGGDLLVGLAGQEITNIYDFVQVLGVLKIGQEIEVVVKRGNSELKLRATPTSRE